MTSGLESFPIQFLFRHMEKSEALEALASKKLGHSLGHLHKAPISCKVTFSLNGDSHHSQISVVTGTGSDIHCHAESDTMYEALDVLNAKVLHQIEKHKFLPEKSRPQFVESEDETSS